MTGNKSRYKWNTVESARTSWVSDVLVSASAAISNETLHELEPYDLDKLERYAPALVAGWVAEVPSRPLSECVELARGEARAAARRQLPDFMSGDRHKDLVFGTEFSEEALDFVLVPVWSFRVDQKHSASEVHLYVNGQTGRVVSEGTLDSRWPGVVASVLVMAGVFSASSGSVPAWASVAAILAGLAIWWRR